ncbi:hypothetical protein ABB37_01055 [Leptomonas pyrrhocoris]|uniref:Uncharacterized protein n=1 Tax=Leptomonas pyrrhocoris TaxID=157538 RepID=A0A0N0DYS7_LEPPY|nr:hypothetical protein ABB37_01055 [Leptomonas pyrrhocoris]KPA84508.1 hypothetical protein ABB37_01055 [Leptomonas pyrrhocoris]|eukprot:XP_015662947.1 hypothetical protein ABB37_01055 [Leptomonas pyrrhocoris]
MPFRCEDPHTHMHTQSKEKEATPACQYEEKSGTVMDFEIFIFLATSDGSTAEVKVNWVTTAAIAVPHLFLVFHRGGGLLSCH